MTKLLTAEEEIELGRRIRKGDEKARAEMILRNDRLALSVANKYRSTGGSLEPEDICQEARRGLLRAADRFNPELQFRFSTSAIPWIYHFVGRAMRDSDKIIRIPEYQLKKLSKMHQAQAIFQNEHDGHAPTEEELAETMQISVAEIKDILAMEKNETISLETSVFGDEPGMTIEHSLVDVNSPNPEKLVLAEEKRETVWSLLTSLSTLEREVIVGRFLAEDKKTLSLIGQKLNLTRERVRQVEARALKKLRHRCSTDSRLKEILCGGGRL